MQSIYNSWYSLSPQQMVTFHYLKQKSFKSCKFRMDWLDLLPVQGTLKILLQHHSSKVTFLVTSMCYHFKFALKGGYILLTLLLLLIL